MTEFHAQLRARALESLQLLSAAQEAGDDYAVEAYQGDLEDIARIARDHGVVLPELASVTSAAA